MCVAQAEISEEFYADWEQTYYKASTAIQDREKKKAEAAELIEINLKLIGATAIEDRLQDVCHFFGFGKHNPIKICK